MTVHAATTDHWCTTPPSSPWAVLHELRLALRSGGALLMFGTAANRRAIPRLAATLTLLYYDTFRALNPLDYARMEPGRVYGYEDFVPRAELECSEYYRQYCVHTFNEHALVGCFGEPGAARAWLNLSRGAAAGAYERRERQLLQALLPHLARALKICARLERADAEHRQLREQVDAVGFATLAARRRRQGRGCEPRRAGAAAGRARAAARRGAARLRRGARPAGLRARAGRGAGPRRATRFGLVHGRAQFGAVDERAAAPPARARMRPAPARAEVAVHLRPRAAQRPVPAAWSTWRACSG
jgi:hypothetical protein